MTTWRWGNDYFGPRCHIYGVDIQDTCRAYENEWTKIFIGDQSDRTFWQRVKKEFRCAASPFQSQIHSIHAYPFVSVIEKREVPLQQFVSATHGTEWQPLIGSSVNLCS